MRQWLFVFLYGALFLMGLFLSPFWAALARKRYARIAGRWTVASDRYFVLAAAIAVLCLGDDFVFAGRTAGNLQYSPSPILLNNWDAAAIALGLSIGLLGKLMLVWLADLEKEPPVWSWTRFGAIITAVWAGVSVLIEVVAR